MARAQSSARLDARAVRVFPHLRTRSRKVVVRFGWAAGRGHPPEQVYVGIEGGVVRFVGPVDFAEGVWAPHPHESGPYIAIVEVLWGRMHPAVLHH